MCRTRTGAAARAASPESPRSVRELTRAIVRTLSRDVAGSGRLAAQRRPHVPVADAIVADPERDQRRADHRRPEPAHGGRQECEVDDGEGGYRGDVRAKHAGHVREPPGALVRGRPDEPPDVYPG